ncbi:MAG: HAD family hydrolase, partial [Phycisphaerae bacterium]
MTAAADGDARSAAFFDVDGTLADTTIVDYYMFFRRRRMSPVVAELWRAAYLAKCVYYLVLDRIDRTRLNVVFYRSYAGLDAADIREHTGDCYRNVVEPRRFVQAAPCVAEHRRAGRRVVFVTGSIDFMVEPLADALGADDVVAPSLVAASGRFTGALDGPPIGRAEKATRIRMFAKTHDIDLTRSYAYGDSIADLPMLEAVGHPHVVNPDRPL